MTYLFVYGTLKKGYHNHRRLRESPFVCHAVTVEKHGFYDLGSFPAMTREGDVYVEGEVYSIDWDVLESCDRLEGHPYFYKREGIEVLDPAGKVMKVDAYICQPGRFEHGIPITIWPTKKE
jgi:gamma-glutamylaminecyclotransferase